MNNNKPIKKHESLRASQRNKDMNNKIVDQYNLSDQKDAKKAVIRPLGSSDKKLRVIALGGNAETGSNNMILLEYGDDAIVIDAGFNLSVDLPGVNYGISDISYLESIKHKVKGYVFSHGHLDHVGATPYVLPRVPAKVYGTSFTIGMVKKQFEEDHFHLDEPFEPDCVVMNMDSHERLVIGCFTVELVRVTHAIPESSLVVVDTPVGRVINTGDFRLDPEPLDHRPTDIERIKELGKEGIALLMSESTTTYREGRTPTEHTLQPSFIEIMEKAPGRVFMAVFSTNINRIQMVINAAVEHGRKVSIAGRSMIAHVELAVRLGNIKIPKGTIVPIRDIANVKDDQVVVICTGGQGELNAVLQRMSVGEHPNITLKPGDTVVVSSTPIPGNERSYETISNDLTNKGVKLFRAPTHDIDGCGPLHVSGHASRDEHRDMIDMTKPKYFMPIYGGALNRKYHIDMAVQQGVKSSDCFMMNNGEILEISEQGARKNGMIHSGTVLIDNTGMVVPGLVVKDRLSMRDDGIVNVVITIDRNNKLLASPDIVTRGFIYIKENEDIINGLRDLCRSLAKNINTKSLDKSKQMIRDEVMHYLYLHTKRSPLVIPVVNVIGGSRPIKFKPKPAGDSAHV
jgi:ribonuclease J